ncbi:MerR family transcriptional regulator [Mycetohabitans sp. B2]|uniref:MerR family transcriptional regulator n=1 Tax=Mycetohabitans rhizoxinica TaxID=412963 RepID=A0ABZ2Q123_9BURK|nr:MerR family transcriptional regulator [Mycetohabitans sp. B2]
MRPADPSCALVTVGEAATRLGVTPRTLKYYEELGLATPTRSKGRYRLYKQADLDRFARILRMRSLGFSLTAITELLKQPLEAPTDAGRPRLSPAALAAWRASLATQLDILNRRVAQVRNELKTAQALRTQLRHDLDYVDQRLAGAPVDVALQRRKARGGAYGRDGTKAASTRGTASPVNTGHERQAIHDTDAALARQRPVPCSVPHGPGHGGNR